MIKATKGGQVSRVNGEEYKGGQFMPEHGEYCGLGKNRVPAAKVVAINAKLTGKRVEWNEKANVFQVIALVKFSSGFVGEQVQFSSPSLATIEKIVA